MADLFDLPFDDEPTPARPAPERASTTPTTRRRPATPPPQRPDPVGEAPSAPAARSTDASDPAGGISRRPVLSVSELTAGLREHLEQHFAEVWVEGEVSNYRLWNGLAYYTLKDTGAQLRVIMFRTAVRRLRFALDDGIHVLARGRITVYDQRGEYQLVAEHVEPQGLGALQLAFEQLKTRLSAEGLFADERKRLLPVFPRRIGIVTSLEGAALRDIIRVITTRHAHVHLVVRGVRVQGEGAAQDIARGLTAIGQVPEVDVIIVGRGGGSIEDLWAFNEEVVARAIAASPVPVISAIGHEVDWTIADFVADVRAATPSNAAELVIARADEFRARITRATEKLGAATARTNAARRARIHALESRRGLASVPLRVAGRARHVDEMFASLLRALRVLADTRRKRWQTTRVRLEARDPIRSLGDLRLRWTRLETRLQRAVDRRCSGAAGDLSTLAARLDSLSPLAVLGRGYALCWSEDGRTLIRDATPELRGQRVAVTLARGRLLCDVREAVAPAQPAASPDSGARPNET